MGIISPDYFRTMGTGLRAGRYFDDRDTPGSMRAVILSESVAHRLFPNEDPLGKRISMPRSPQGAGAATVVGIVADVRHEGLDREIKPQAYLPYRQWTQLRQISLVVRSSVEPGSLAAAVRAAVQAVDPDCSAGSASLRIVATDRVSNGNEPGENLCDLH